MNTTSSNSVVAGLVTSLVSVWFVMAAAAIFADPAAASRGERQALARSTPTTEVAIAPAARLTITVEASRLKS